jgi:hypothetical protein
LKSKNNAIEIHSLYINKVRALRILNKKINIFRKSEYLLRKCVYINQA